MNGCLCQRPVNTEDRAAGLGLPGAPMDTMTQRNTSAFAHSAGLLRSQLNYLERIQNRCGAAAAQQWAGDVLG